MTDSTIQRQHMVDAQVRANNVTDPRIQQAMLAVPREAFVPPVFASIAYMDGCIAVAPDRKLLDARCFAKLAQLAAIRATDHVLDVGCSSGYSTAVLARIAADVVALEDDSALAELAARTLQAQDVRNARVVQGPLTAGYPQAGPYNVIFVGGGVEQRPDSLLAQLKDGGRLVCVIHDSQRGAAHVFLNAEGAFSDRIDFDADAPVLPGFRKVAGFVF